MHRRALLACLIAIGGLMGTSCNQASGSDTGTAESELTTDHEEGNGPPGPPQEAVNACNGLEEGASCTVVLGDQAMEGTCRRGPDASGPMACAPARPPPPAFRGPPPEALAACEGSSDGASCTVALSAKVLAGTCRTGPEVVESVCVPNDMPPPPRGDRPHGPPPEAMKACETLANGADCSVTLPARSIAGICRHGPNGNEPLACAPGDMPPPPPGP